VIRQDLISSQLCPLDDKCSALHAAAFRYDARLMELEQQFETKAAALRAAYLSEVATIQSDEAT
jgi:hypothetical protein